MVGSPGFAHSLCLGRSADSRINRIGNGRKQHKRRSQHHNEQCSHNGLSEQHGGWQSNRYSRWSDEPDHNPTDTDHQSDQQYYDHKLNRNWLDVCESEHHGNDRHDWNLDHPQCDNRNHSDLAYDGYYGISRRCSWIRWNDGHECNGNCRSDEFHGGNSWQY